MRQGVYCRRVCLLFPADIVSQVISHVFPLTSDTSAITMTHQSDDQAPGVSADTGYFSSEARGGSSSEAGSGGSSCDHHHDDIDSDNDDGMDTIKRNTREPIRPPRTIDMAPHSLDYYNLCHPAPSEPTAPAPAIPRRAPYISHGAAEQSQWSGDTHHGGHVDTGSRCGSAMSTLTSLTSRHTNTLNNRQQRKYLTAHRRQRKGSVCNCKHATGKDISSILSALHNM